MEASKRWQDMLQLTSLMHAVWLRASMIAHRDRATQLTTHFPVLCPLWGHLVTQSDSFMHIG